MIKVVKCPVYGVEIHIMFYPTKDEILSVKDKEGRIPEDEFADICLTGLGRVVNFDGHNVGIIFNENPLRISTVTHEIYHLAYAIMESISNVIHHSGEHNEEFAYYISYLTTLILSIIAEYDIKTEWK